MYNHSVGSAISPRQLRQKASAERKRKRAIKRFIKKDLAYALGTCLCAFVIGAILAEAILS